MDALFSIFKERERQEKISGMALHSQPALWILDTGASFHLTSNFNALENVHESSYQLILHCLMGD